MVHELIEIVEGVYDPIESSETEPTDQEDLEEQSHRVAVNDLHYEFRFIVAPLANQAGSHESVGGGGGGHALRSALPKAAIPASIRSADCTPKLSRIVFSSAAAPSLGKQYWPGT